MTSLLWQEYHSSRTLPSDFPTSCPSCASKVKLCHINYAEHDALYICVNLQCNWPLDTLQPEEYMGKSNPRLFRALQKEEKKKRKEKRAKRNDDDGNESANTSQSDGFVSANDVVCSKSATPKTTNNEAEEMPFSTAGRTPPAFSGGESPFLLPDRPVSTPRRRCPTSDNEAYFTPSHASSIGDSDADYADISDTELHYSFNIPNMLSPLHSSPRRTPSSTPASMPSPAWSYHHQSTPQHHIPELLSPLPSSTPRRGLETASVSVRSTRDEFDTDSEMSDIVTPRTDILERLHENRKVRHYFDSEKLEQPSTEKEATTGPEWSGIPATTEEEKQPSSPVKVTLKRMHTSGSGWNVQRKTSTEDEDEGDEEERGKVPSASSGKKSSTKKLDKVVLNLKKTAGNNWNIQAASSSGADLDTSTETKSAAEPSKKRSRKSKTAPVKKVHKDIGMDVAATTAPEVEKQPIESDIELPTVAAESEGMKKPPELSTTGTDVKKSPVKRTYGKRSKTDAIGAPPRPPKVLASVSNRVFLSTGVNISISVDVGDKTANRDPTSFSMAEIAEMSQSTMVSEEDQIPEFRSLLKAMGGTELDTLEFVQKVQKSLRLDQQRCRGGDGNELTFHVGVGKASIDLPSQTLDVSSGGGAKVLLTADSDGIEGEAMRSSSPPPPPPAKKRGRQRKQLPQPQPPLPDHGQQQEEEELLPPPTMVQPTPSRFEGNIDLDEPLPAYLEHDPPLEVQSDEQIARQVGLTDHFANPHMIEVFKYHLNYLMMDYVCPPEWIAQGIDPTVAMLVTKRADPNCQQINFDAMLEAYAKLKKFDLVKQQQQQQLQMQDQRRMQQQQQHHHHQQVAIDLRVREQQHPEASSSSSSRPTYTELQTVRGKESANEVLRQHQNAHMGATPRTPNTPQSPSTLPSSPALPRTRNSCPPPSSPAQGSSTATAQIKQEVLELPPTPQTVDPAGSVVPTSVIPAPASVQIVDRDAVGVGDKVVTLTFGKSRLGPIRLQNDEQVRLVSALAKERFDAFQHRGKNILSAPQSRAKAERARTELPADVVAYIHKAFTKKGMKEHQVGRRRTNYPKRSQVIKVDPKTGKKIFPIGHPLHAEGEMGTVKQELIEDEFVPEEEEAVEEEAAVPTQPEVRTKRWNLRKEADKGQEKMDEETSLPVETYNPPTPVVQANIESILEASQMAQNDDTSAIDCPLPNANETSLDSGVVKVPESHMVTRNRAKREESAKTATKISRTSSSAAAKKTTTRRRQAKSGPKQSVPLTMENLEKLQKQSTAIKRSTSTTSTASKGRYRAGYTTSSQPEALSSTPNSAILKNISDIIAMQSKNVVNASSEVNKKTTTTTTTSNKIALSVPELTLTTRNKKRKDEEEACEVGYASVVLSTVSDKDAEVVEEAGPSGFKPSATATSSSKQATSVGEVYVRHGQGERIKKLLEKREKKKQLIKARATASKGGVAVSSEGRKLYRGYKEADKTKKEKKVGLPSSLARRFSDADEIGGVKKVIRGGQVIEIQVEKKPLPPPPPAPEEMESASAKKAAKTTQDEQDLMAELFQLADDLDVSGSIDHHKQDDEAEAVASSAPFALEQQQGDVVDDFQMPSFDDLF